MNCPKCDKQPSGLKHYLTLGGVSLDLNMQGFIRCQHCNTLLRQPKYLGVWGKFDPKVWLYFSGVLAFIFLMFFFIDHISATLEILLPEIAAVVGTFLLVGLAFVGGIVGMFTLIPRYAIYELAEETEVEDQISLSKTGKRLYTSFLMLVLVVSLGLLLTLDFDTINVWVIALGLGLYIAGILLISNWITQKYRE